MKLQVPDALRFICFGIRDHGVSPEPWWLIEQPGDPPNGLLRVPCQLQVPVAANDGAVVSLIKVQNEAVRTAKKFGSPCDVPISQALPDASG